MKRELILKIGFLSIVIFSGWFFNYDGVCGLVKNCNRGINPTVVFGWPVPTRLVSLYGGTQFNTVGIVLNIGVILVLIWLFFIKKKK